MSKREKKRKRHERSLAEGGGAGEARRDEGRPSFFFAGLFSRAPAPLGERTTPDGVGGAASTERTRDEAPRMNATDDETTTSEAAVTTHEELATSGAPDDEAEPSPISESFRDVEATPPEASARARATSAALPAGDSIPEALGRDARRDERDGPAREGASEPDDELDLAPVGPTEPPENAAPLEASTAPSAARSKLEVEREIAELEARLDALLAERDRRAGETRRAPAARAHVDAALYEAQRRRIEDDTRAFEIDELGLDPAFEARLEPLLDFLYERWFRVEVTGLESVPVAGPVVLVANHAGGAVPLDGLMLRAALRRASPRRELRFLAEDAVYHLPFAGTALTRLGAVRACPENAERLLQRGEAIAVFPEGEKGLGKPASSRYRLQRFGRGGFVRLCLRTRAPLVACAIVGSEETSPTLARLERLPRLLGLPSLPISALGALPAPAKWRIQLGPLRRFSEPPESADDEDLVARLADETRRALAGMLEGMLARRRSVFRG